jgi:hypothetical protein
MATRVDNDDFYVTTESSKETAPVDDVALTPI